MREVEFDELVDAMNEWLSKPRGMKWRLEGLMRGFLFRGPEPHPVYGRKDLSVSQKNAVAFGSDVKRVRLEIEQERARQSPEWYDNAMRTNDHIYDLFKSLFHEG